MHIVAYLDAFPNPYLTDLEVADRDPEPSLPKRERASDALEPRSNAGDGNARGETKEGVGRADTGRLWEAVRVNPYSKPSGYSKLGTSTWAIAEASY
jgi:hypothetical protein